MIWGNDKFKGSLLLPKTIIVILSLSFIWAGRIVHCLEITAAATAGTRQQEYLPTAILGEQFCVLGKVQILFYSFSWPESLFKGSNGGYGSGLFCLEWRFTGFSVWADHLGSTLKCRFWGSTVEILIQWDYCGTKGSAFLTTTPSDACQNDVQTTLWEALLCEF